MTKKVKKFVVKPLGEEQVMQAYPLVQSASPQLTLDQWMDYVQTLSQEGDSDPRGGGVMSVQNGEGYIYGIYCHEVEANIQHGRVLKVSNFVAANLYDAKSVTGGLIDSMASVARDSGCGAVHVDLPEEIRPGPRLVDGIASQFKGAGYQVESVALCRSIKKK
ncbi:MAG: hypothetical protein V3S44_01210 [Alphaproteobacteria bacterium]